MIHFQNTIFKKKISIPINISYDGILKHGKVIRCDSFVSCFTYRESWRGYCPFIVFIQNHWTFSMLIVCHLTFIWILCGLLDECFPLSIRFVNSRHAYWSPSLIFVDIWFDLLVLNATSSNMSAISWRQVLVVEEFGVPGENHRPWISNW